MAIEVETPPETEDAELAAEFAADDVHAGPAFVPDTATGAVPAAQPGAQPAVQPPVRPPAANVAPAQAQPAPAAAVPAAKPPDQPPAKVVLTADAARTALAVEERSSELGAATSPAQPAGQPAAPPAAVQPPPGGSPPQPAAFSVVDGQLVPLTAENIVQTLGKKLYEDPDQVDQKTGIDKLAKTYPYIFDPVVDLLNALAGSLYGQQRQLATATDASARQMQSLTPWIEQKARTEARDAVIEELGQGEGAQPDARQYLDDGAFWAWVDAKASRQKLSRAGDTVSDRAGNMGLLLSAYKAEKGLAGSTRVQTAREKAAAAKRSDDDLLRHQPAGGKTAAPTPGGKDNDEKAAWEEDEGDIVD